MKVSVTEESAARPPDKFASGDEVSAVVDSTHCGMTLGKYWKGRAPAH